MKYSPTSVKPDPAFLVDLFIFSSNSDKRPFDKLDKLENSTLFPVIRCFPTRKNLLRVETVKDHTNHQEFEKTGLPRLDENASPLVQLRSRFNKIRADVNSHFTAEIEALKRFRNYVTGESKQRKRSY